MQEELACHQQIVLTFGSGVHYLHQQTLSIIEAAHALVGLRQAAESIQVVVFKL